MITLLFLTGLFEDLPEATLAAVVIAALVELVDIAALVRLYRLSTRELGRIYGFAARPDFIAAIAAMLGVLVFDTLPGLFIGIAVSSDAVSTARRGRTSPCSARSPARPARTPTSAAIPRTSSRPASSCSGSRAASSSPTPTPSATGSAPAPRARTRAVVLDAESMPFIDFTAATMLEELAADLERDGIRLVLARDIGQVRDVLAAGAGDRPLETFPTVEAAVESLSR